MDKRILKETERILKEPVPGIIARPREDNYRHFEVVITGPASTPYENGQFHLELFLPSDYPLDAPKLRFLTPIYHPNIDRLGRICLDVLKDRWSPALQIRTVLLSVQALLGAPNPDDPLAEDVAKRWREDEAGAIAEATRWTLLHAKAYNNATPDNTNNANILRKSNSTLEEKLNNSEESNDLPMKIQKV